MLPLLLAIVFHSPEICKEKNIELWEERKEIVASSYSKSLATRQNTRSAIFSQKNSYLDITAAPGVVDMAWSGLVKHSFVNRYFTESVAILLMLF